MKRQENVIGKKGKREKKNTYGVSIQGFKNNHDYCILRKQRKIQTDI